MSMIQEYKNFNNQGGVKAPHNNKETTMQKVYKIKYDEKACNSFLKSSKKKI